MDKRPRPDLAQVRDALRERDERTPDPEPPEPEPAERGDAREDEPAE
jgi:hypothetical protein